MGSTFSGISAALSSLYAQRRGLEVTAQNIANANTDGFSRQRLGLASVGAPSRPAIFAVGEPTGNGVATTDLTRMRDEFLEDRGRAERSTGQYLNGKQEIYSKVEGAIGEPSDTGLQSQFSEFWSAWDALANRPGDAAARAELLQRGTTLADSLQGTYDSVASLWDSTREQLDAYVTEVNTVAATVGELNESVVRTKQAGLPGNELADQRDLAVLRLAELTGGQALTKYDGSVDVLVNGSSLVAGSEVRTLVVSGAGELPNQAADPVTLTWSDTGAVASIPEGSVAATLEALTTILPGVTVSLDGVADSLATTVNTQHRLGFDLNGVAGDDFFVTPATPPVTATTLRVAITDPLLVAASSFAPVAPATTTLDGSNADAIARIATSVTGPDTTYRQFVVDLGIQAQSANRRAEIQNAISAAADAARTAQSGVNLDEEMTNLLTYQRAYEAASKVISVIDATLETLITGLRR
jgi:flagellar hook-associated protein 1 FlgK